MNYYKLKSVFTFAMPKYFPDPNAVVKIGEDFHIRQSPKHSLLLEILGNITNNKFPENPPFIFDLEEEGVLTDVLRGANMGAQGFFVNKKTKELLEKFNLGIHKFYEAKIFDKGFSYKYYWLHLIDLDIKSIINNNEEYTTLKSAIYNLPKPFCELDLFITSEDIKIFASQKLVEAIIAEGILGFEYKELKY